jgi:glyoxylase-like metal-dependent hydrolase (beta-lactamase superfamily II)
MDVLHDGLPGVISPYLLDAPEPTLVDPGPSASLDVLRGELEEVGVGVGDLRYILLTHIHLDHAGAVGHLVRENPGITVVVHEDGAAHLADPERLVASTRRTFGEAHDRLWGEVLPVAPGRLRGWRPGDGRPLAGLRPHPTPGHIHHHLAWEVENSGVLLTGDSLGLVLHSMGPSHPATPPPAVHLEEWRDTLGKRLAVIEVDAFGPAHFGLHADLHGRRIELLEALNALADRVERAMEGGPEAEEADAEAFHQESIAAQAEFQPEGWARSYFSTFPARMDWEGMRFHLARSKS